MKKCYMCDEEGVTKEHAPPFSFFLPGYRNQLITVPSCKFHNNRQSDDVEFIRTLLTFSSGSSSNIALEIFKRKVLKDVKRKPKKYEKYIGEKVEFTNTDKVAFQIDRDRFDLICEGMIRALFFHTYNAQYLDELFIYSPNIYKHLDNNTIGLDESMIEGLKISKLLLNNLEITGMNPKVFRYKINVINGRVFFASQFYESFEIFGVTPTIP